MANHKFGMKIRFVVLIAVNSQHFIAHYIWKHDVNAEQFLAIHFDQEPVTFLTINGRKISFRNHENGRLYQDLDRGCYDIMLDIDEDSAKIEKLSNIKIMELMHDDPNWSVESI